MNTRNISLMDVMAVKRDAARKARKAAADKARRTRKKALVRPRKPVPNRAAAICKASAARKALDAAIAAKAAPVRGSVKQAVLDAFYVDKKRVQSTKDAVISIQAAHPGMNESSIRVWISDFRKDGSIKLVKKDGREALLQAGKLGKFGMR